MEQSVNKLSGGFVESPFVVRISIVVSGKRKGGPSRRSSPVSFFLPRYMPPPPPCRCKGRNLKTLT